MKEEVNNEETNKKKNSYKGLFIIIGFGIVSITALSIFVHFYNKEPEPEEDKYANVIRDTVSIQKLQNFVSAAMYNDYGYTGLAYDFAKGMNKLTNNQKNQIIYQQLVNIQYVTEKIYEDDIPEKYKNDPYLTNPNIVMSKLSSRTFEKEYEKVFGEAPKYDEESLKEINGCPSVYKYDSRTKKIFLFNECELEGDTILFTKTYNYKFDDDYYYVYQYVALVKKDSEGNKKYYRLKEDKEVEVEDFSGNESKFETVVWKFDKDYNFISTTNE